jgi:hypothetical protein
MMQSPVRPSASSRWSRGWLRLRKPSGVMIGLIIVSTVLLIGSSEPATAEKTGPALLPAATVLTSPTWKEVSSGPSPPSMAALTTMVYDTGDSEIVTVTWSTAGPCGMSGETWTFAQGQWQDLSLRVEPPVYDPLLAYDSSLGDVVLYNSDFCQANPTSSTWTFHGGVWTNITATSGPQPPPRQVASMAWDPSTQAVILFSGTRVFGASPLLNDTWEFANGTWTNISASSTGSSSVAPPPRTFAAFAGDPLSGWAILFGGLDSVGDLSNNATYGFDYGRWAPGSYATAPQPRYGPAMAYDPTLQGLVLFGGSYPTCCAAPPSGPPALSDSWLLPSGAYTNNWVQLRPASSPPPRLGAAMAYEAEDQYLVLFGGIGPNGHLNDTWIYANSTSPSGSVDWAGALVFGFLSVVVVIAVALLVRGGAPRPPAQPRF